MLIQFDLFDVRGGNNVINTATIFIANVIFEYVSIRKNVSILICECPQQVYIVKSNRRFYGVFKCKTDFDWFYFMKKKRNRKCQ